MYQRNKYRHAWQPYVVAMALTSTAAALRLWPLHALGLRLAWLTFYPAVMGAALYGGFSAGLLGAFLSCLTILYLWPVFVDQPFIRDSTDWLGMAVFFATCTMISSVAEAMLRARAREKHANEQQEAANIKLQEANKELEAFAYSVSHDLRAPLRHIDGFADLLYKHATAALDEKGKRYLKTISDSTKVMGVLIDELLGFSRMGRVEMRRAKTNLKQLVQQEIASLSQDIQGRTIDWKVNPLPEVEADPSMLKLVLQNLISNAVKYTRTRERGEIEIGCSANDNQHIFYVRDNGVGFNMNYADKLFGVFQRLHGSEEFEGTGIGLANVRRIIQRHGGRTWAEGKVNEGATFFFTLERSKDL